MTVRRPTNRRARLIRLTAFAALMLAEAGCGAAYAEDPDISSRRAAERRDFTNEEIKDGFFKIALNAELQFGAPAERVRKFDEPVRIFVASQGQPDRAPEIASIVADIRAHVNHLDIAITSDKKAANFFVTLVAERDINKVIHARYGSGKASADSAIAQSAMPVGDRQGQPLPYTTRRGDPACRCRRIHLL